MVPNNLQKYRLELGISQKDMSRKIKVHQVSLSKMEKGEGYWNPLYKNGKKRPWVDLICEILNKSFKEIWPIQYKEEVSIKEASTINNCDDDQLIDITIGEYSISSSKANIENHICIMSILNLKLNAMQKDCIIRNIVYNETLDSIGQTYNLTRERIRQINEESFKLIRKYINKEREKDENHRCY